MTVTGNNMVETSLQRIGVEGPHDVGLVGMLVASSPFQNSVQ